MGAITKDEADDLWRRYDEIARETLDPAEARARLQKELEAAADFRERAALLTEIARSRILEDLANFRDNKGQPNKPEAWVDMHENTGRMGSFIQDVEGRRKTIIAGANSELRDTMRELRRGWFLGDLTRTSKLGSRKKQARAENFMRELSGVATGDETAATMARAWEKVSEGLRTRFNAAGGNIGKLDGWMLPQSHDPAALLSAREVLPDGTILKGQAAWVHHHMQPGVLNREKMRSHLTGKRLSDTDLRRGLAVAFDRIVSDGYSDKDVTATPAGRGALYTQHMEHRFIHYANADAWMAYAKRFGNPDVFATMMGHIGVMAKDIAAMEVFGPNPNAMRTYVGNALRKEAGSDPAKIQASKSALAKADGMWALMRGVEPRNETVAEVMSSVRNVISATALGGAWFSSLTDPAFGADVRKRIGMGFAKANFGRLMVEGLRELITHGSREDAIEAMLSLDAYENVLRRTASEVRSWDHQFWTGWMADRTLTWGLMLPWTQGLKHNVGLDIMTFVGGLVGKGFADLPAGVKQAFHSHGIDAAGWDKLRSAPLHKGRYLRPNEMLEIDLELGQRYLQMIHRETRHAVPEATVRSRSMVTATAPPGSLVGEMARSMAQFKGFGIAVIQLKTGDIARDIQQGHGWTAAGLTTALIVTSTLLGAVAMALKDMRDGRDPRKWLDEKTWLDPQHWGAAFLQAGGLGIYGDLLFSDVNRFGNGLAGTIAGPLVGRVSDLRGLVVGQPLKAANDEKTTVGGTVTTLLRRNIPFTNMWMWSVAYQNLVMDTLQRMIDPDHARAFRRRISNRERDYKQGYWYAPGRLVPDRAPDLSRIFSTR